MHNKIAFAQLQKRIDRPRLPPPRRPRQILPLKQLARTHERHVLRHNSKPSLKMSNRELQPLFSKEPRIREQLPKSLDLGIRLRHDKHFVAVTYLVELIFDFGDLTTKPLNRLKLQMSRRLHRPT